MHYHILRYSSSRKFFPLHFTTFLLEKKKCPARMKSKGVQWKVESPH